MRLKPYPKMKDSGVEWIGKIPEGWELIKIKRLFQQQSILEIQDGNHGELHPIGEDFVDEGIPFLTADKIKNGQIIFNECKKLTKEFVSKLRIGFSKSGDVILTHKGTLGAVTTIPENTDLVILSPQTTYYRLSKNIKTKYFKYLLQSSLIQEQLLQLGKQSTRYYVGITEQKNLRIVFTQDLDEQKQIAEFLDKETSKIDSDIEKNQRLIELLKEKRQSTINHAVTKGLDLTVPMKDSGVEWIGEIPEHWEILLVKRILRLSQGIQIPENEQSFEVHESYNRFLRIVDFTERVEKRFVKVTDKRYSLTENEVVMIRYGANAGKVFLGKKGIFANNMFKFVINQTKLISNFLFHYMNQEFIKKHLQHISGTTTMPNINHSIVYDFQIPLPPTSEQKQIAEFLDKETEKIDSLITKTESQVERLQEFRQSLITSAVTGKIDVTSLAQ